MRCFIKDLTERAIKTFFQSLSASIVGVVAFDPIEWGHALTIAGIATVVSVCTSMASFHFGEKGTACLLKNNNHESEDNGNG